MLKNLSDYLSFFTIVIIAGISLRVFLVSLVRDERDDNTQSRIQLIRNYADNTEE